jgi:hypothetical protein
MAIENQGIDKRESVDCRKFCEQETREKSMMIMRIVSMPIKMRELENMQKRRRSGTKQRCIIDQS